MAERDRGSRFGRRMGRAIFGRADSSVPKAKGRKSSVSAKARRAKPPNAIGQGPLSGEPGFGLVVVAIVKDEAAYLEEWIAYHHALGVDHFVLYDNGSTDDSAAVLARYINHGLVTRIDWPMAAGQHSAYNHALRMFGGAARWLGYFDPDEYLVPLEDDDIPSLLARFPDAADVRIPRVEFGYSGQRTPPKGLTIEAYTQVANVLELDPGTPARVKSIVCPRSISAVGVHVSFPADEPAAGAPTRTIEEEVRGLAQFNHYYTRSFEEFEAKRHGGSATGKPTRPGVPWDTPTLATDSSAQRFAESTRANLERLRQLEPRPYDYGSQLGLAYFPRPNNLARFAGYTVANIAAGRDEPARFATTHVRNRHEGIGLVADIASETYAPRRDGFSASAHTQGLLEHLRGRVETSLALSRELPMAAAAGSLAIPGEGPALLDLPSGAAELYLELPEAEMRRCYALAFLAEVPGPTRIEASLLRRAGSEGAPVSIDLPVSKAAIGVVEVEASPEHGARMRLRIESEAESLHFHDLFVISYG